MIRGGVYTCTRNFQCVVFLKFVIRRRNACIGLAKKPPIIASVIRRIFIIYTFQVHCCYVTRNPGVQVIETFFFEVVCYLGQNDSSSKPKRLQAGVNIIIYSIQPCNDLGNVLPSILLGFRFLN